MSEHDHNHNHHDHDHHHNHDHDHEHKVVLVDENGQEKEFDIVTWFEVESQEYVVLVSADADDDQEGVILKVQEENGEEFLVDIEDDEEWEKVLSVYEQLIQED
ncbi:DUF1292 domain-containing protein [Tepidibacillus decaturensis]|uniref:UPF0473 protein U473_07125 n=1 Tax=Tepidibacillus decaturensis TaxID=1413211 RepID=A0A135L478_9BACI|nr:DUF1292 domain-containing protein [Tepidibacillus decaturensis]KXG43808.1 hypothetical protein U473_07125 [Tepidibacillus decaturensis]